MTPLLRGAETAVLEDAGQLKRYQAQGWRAVTWAQYWAARRTATDALMERLIAAAGNVPAIAPAGKQVYVACLACRQQFFAPPSPDGKRVCINCGRRWVEDAQQR